MYYSYLLTLDNSHLVPLAALNPSVEKIEASSFYGRFVFSFAFDLSLGL